MNTMLLWGVLISFSVCSVIDAASVPVIAWSSTRNLFSTRQISAGEEITPQSLKQDFLDKGLGQEPQTIVLILLNKLSLGDLTRFGDAYGSDNQGGILSNIKTAMDTSASKLVVPQTDTSDLVDDLIAKVKAQDGEVTEVSDLLQLASFPVDSARTRLVIVRVDPSESMEKQLEGADSIAKTVMERFQGGSSHAPYTVLFTADHASKHSSRSSGRHLLEVGASTSNTTQFTFINFTSPDGCEVYLYADSITVGLIDMGQKGYNQTLKLPNDGWTLDGSECNSNKSLDFGFQISNLTGPNGTTWIDSIAVMLKFNTTSMNFWFVEESTITYQLTDSSDSEEVVNLPEDLITPVGWSYHCGDLVFTKANKTGLTQLLEIKFHNFQIQPFAIANSKFSSANDCIGYFTAPIWMGLLTALLIILIVGFGVSMMATVKVMDKFDDPKGKPLMINVSE